MGSNKIMALGCLLLLSACSTAGPYITNISSDGTGGLTVEKCKVEFNGFLWFVTTGDCMTSYIRLGIRDPVAVPNPNRP